MNKKVNYILFLILFSSKLFSQVTTNCTCYIPVDSTFQIVPMTQGPDSGVPPGYENNNSATVNIPLPFSFCFYGQNFDSVYISNNGIISFGHPVYNFISGGGFPLGNDTAIIAPFYADVYTLNLNGFVRYQITPTHMIVLWENVGYNAIDIDFWDTFQLIITNGTDPILPAGNNVSFCHLNMQWACGDNSGGFNGFGGLPAIVGVNRGNGVDYAQIGTFNVPGTTYYGPFAIYDGLNWLNGKSFVFNTCVTGNTIPPVLVKSGSCDTLIICAGNTATVTSTFLLSQSSQTCTLSATCNGITGLSVIDTSLVNGIDSITVQLSTSVADTGTHILNVIATDNSIPVQINTQSYVVIVQTCTGLNETILNNYFNVYPNPVSGNFTIEINDKQSLVNNEIKMYDLPGNILYSATLNAGKTTVDISSIPKGIYFLQLFNENGITGRKKIVVQ